MFIRLLKNHPSIFSPELFGSSLYKMLFGKVFTGNDATAVSPWDGSKLTVVCALFPTTSQLVSFDPSYPVKQIILSGAKPKLVLIVRLAFSIGTSHPLPVAFQ